jgi:hypothetical protein
MNWNELGVYNLPFVDAERKFRCGNEFIMRKYIPELNQVIESPWSEAKFLGFVQFTNAIYNRR